MNSITIRILHTALFTFFYYLTIGLLLAVLPGFVHLHLGLSPLWAGFAVSAQYLATLATRPKAGRMTDVVGPRATVLRGQVYGLLSGLCLVAAALLLSKAMVCFAVLLSSRVILGSGESCVATGLLTWGLGRVGPEYASQVISWNGIASYGAMAAGAPLGIWLETRYGFGSIGAVAMGVSALSLDPLGRQHVHKVVKFELRHTPTPFNAQSGASRTDIGSNRLDHLVIMRWALSPSQCWEPR